MRDYNNMGENVNYVSIFRLLELFILIFTIIGSYLDIFSVNQYMNMFIIKKVMVKEIYVYKVRVLYWEEQ